MGGQQLLQNTDCTPRCVVPWVSQLGTVQTIIRTLEHVADLHVVFSGLHGRLDHQFIGFHQLLLAYHLLGAISPSSYRLRYTS